MADSKETFALSMIKKGELAARFFGQRATRRERIKKIAHATELLAAVIALTANIPHVQHILGSGATEYVEIGSLLVLIFVVIVDRVFGKDPPERLQDYSRCLLLYTGKLTTIMHSKRTQRGEAEMDVLLALMEENIADASSKWP